MWYEILNTLWFTGLIMWIKYDQVRVYNSLTRHQKVIYEKVSECKSQIEKLDLVDQDCKDEENLDDLLGTAREPNSQRPEPEPDTSSESQNDTQNNPPDPSLPASGNDLVDIVLSQVEQQQQQQEDEEDLDLDDDEDALSPEEEIDILNNLKHLEGEPFEVVDRHIGTIGYVLRDVQLEGRLKKYHPKVINVQVEDGTVTKFTGIGGR